MEGTCDWRTYTHSGRVVAESGIQQSKSIVLIHRTHAITVLPNNVKETPPLPFFLHLFCLLNPALCAIFLLVTCAISFRKTNHHGALLYALIPCQYLDGSLTSRTIRKG
jgi:hypothetical protein